MNAPNDTTLTAAKLSRRAESLGTENAFVVLAEVNALVRQGKDIVSFCIGQPDFPTPRNIQKAAIEAIKSGKHGYTPSAGIDELRVAAANDIGARRGIKVAPVEYDASTLDFLIKLKWLREQDASSAAAVAQAIQALLKASADA